MNKLPLAAAAFILTILLALSVPLQAAPRYYFQDLGVLPGGTQTYAHGLNRAGQVVGEALLDLAPIARYQPYKFSIHLTSPQKPGLFIDHRLVIGPNRF
jgi:hypothetical protein